MPCYHPITAYQDAVYGGALEFNRNKAANHREIQIACGQCKGCRLERSREWAMRCVHEAQMHKWNCWDTLTYNNDNLPEHGDLRKADVQKFLKRVRRRGYKFRYYYCGEYGEETKRPHYHICMFGHTWLDRRPYQANHRGEIIYRSAELEEIWGMGECKTAELSFDNAAYTARYCMQKLTGPRKEEYTLVDEHGEYYTKTQEYNDMSRRPGIAAGWFEKWGKIDTYPNDYVVLKGVKSNPPKYYDELLKKVDEEMLLAVKEKRLEMAHERRHDNTWQRLETKERVMNAATSQLKRTI